MTRGCSRSNCSLSAVVPQSCGCLVKCVNRAMAESVLWIRKQLAHVKVLVLADHLVLLECYSFSIICYG